MIARLCLAGLVLAAASPGLVAADPQPLDIAARGRARLSIRIPVAPSAVERHAAAELASYLSRISGATFEIVAGPGGPPSIEVGATAAVRAAGIDPGELGEEEWIIRTTDGRLLLTGGAPRGLLYAVYRFLEQDLGVRWWTPWEEWVPRVRRLAVGPIDRRGSPFFAQRDIFGVRGSTLFHARNRLNGESSGLNAKQGGSRRFGPPFHVHTFERRLPVGEWFGTHPEFFSELGGFRYGGENQWCLTQPALLDAAEAQIRESILAGDSAAAQAGLSPPQFYDLSQNDWGKPCACSACSALVEREGSQSGPLIRFVDLLARRIAADRPELKLTTLAYSYTFDPPQQARAGEHVVVRLADLYRRDFAHSLLAPQNAGSRLAVRGWAERTEHLVIWDYRVSFHERGDLPRADHRWLGEEMRFYAAAGVEGLYVQTEFADVASMHDLEVWLMAKLLEDPLRDDEALIDEFLRGYYGAAAGPIAAYLHDLGRAVDRHGGRLGFSPAPEAYTWLDASFIESAQRRFRSAERLIAGDRKLRDRVRGARVALDRATLARWELLWPADRAPWSRRKVARRYEKTRKMRIERRLTGALRIEALENLAVELDGMRKNDRP